MLNLAGNALFFYFLAHVISALACELVQNGDQQANVTQAKGGEHCVLLESVEVQGLLGSYGLRPRPLSMLSSSRANSLS